MSKKFIGELTAFIVLSLVIPLTYLCIRFNLFTTRQSISIWGLIVVVFIIGIIALFINYYLSGMKTRHSLLKQILSGFVKLILPLGILLAISIWMYLKSDYIVANMKMFIEAIVVIMVCEIPAIIINPLPKWCFDNNVEGLAQITDKLLHKNEDKKEE